MWAKLMMILKGIGKFTMMMLQTEGTRIRNEIGPMVLEIVKEVEAQCPSGSCSGEEKFQKALGVLLAKLPEIAIRHIRGAVEDAVEIINSDIDGDGIPDIFDACPDDPDCQ